MFRKYVIICALLLTLPGCGRNLCEPTPPVIVAPTLEQQMKSLDTPYKTAIWLRENATYDLDYNTGWGCCEDQALVLAKRLYDSNGHGVCGQMAAFYIVAARTHGSKCGAVLYYTESFGHALGWIVEDDGTVSITDNFEYHKSKYSSYTDFYASWKQNMIIAKTTNAILLDSKFSFMEELP